MIMMSRDMRMQTLIQTILSLHLTEAKRIRPDLLRKHNFKELVRKISDRDLSVAPEEKGLHRLQLMSKRSQRWQILQMDQQKPVNSTLETSRTCPEAKKTKIQLMKKNHLDSSSSSTSLVTSSSMTMAPTR
jgi:hypothetical protein